MRTTVKLGPSRSLVEPAAHGVKLTLKAPGGRWMTIAQFRALVAELDAFAAALPPNQPVPSDPFYVTPDQAGAAIFGMEQALEVGELRASREAA